MVEHQEQSLRQGHVSQVRTTTISEEQNGEKRDDGKYDDAVEDPWESETEEPHQIQRWGQEAFARRCDHQISSQKSTLSNRLHSRAGQPSLAANRKMERQEFLKNELPREIRKELLKEHRTNKASHRYHSTLSGRKEVAGGKTGAFLEGTLDRRVW